VTLAATPRRDTHSARSAGEEIYFRLCHLQCTPAMRL
jgi:hypothetical protein